MQILFVSSIAAGGSGMSQRQLARRLTQRGHRVDILAATPESTVVRPVYDRLVDASTRLRATPARPALLALQRRLGRRVHRTGTGDPCADGPGQRSAPADQVLVIGGYIDQLHQLSEYLDAPVVQGATTNKERERLFDAFRAGEIPTLVISRVGNFSIDLPEAAVAIQVSGTFGSRQEEAQRLGRVLRPKADGRQAHFYTVVARDTIDTEYAAHRQRFLAEQGYAYTIVDADDVLST